MTEKFSQNSLTPTMRFSSSRKWISGEFQQEITRQLLEKQVMDHHQLTCISLPTSMVSLHCKDLKKCRRYRYSNKSYSKFLSRNFAMFKLFRLRILFHRISKETLPMSVLKIHMVLPSKQPKINGMNQAPFVLKISSRTRKSLSTSRHNLARVASINISLGSSEAMTRLLEWARRSTISFMKVSSRTTFTMALVDLSTQMETITLVIGLMENGRAMASLLIRQDVSTKANGNSVNSWVIDKILIENQN